MSANCVELKILSLQGNRAHYLNEIVSCFEHEQHTYLVLKLILGMPLYKYIWNRGQLSEVLARQVTGRIIVGLMHLHDHGYIHGDLKSGNIMLDDNGHVTLFDFGLGIRFANTACATKGTPYIQAPETTPSAASDYWSLGIILYEMVYGQPPISYRPCALDITNLNIHRMLNSSVSSECNDLLRLVYSWITFSFYVGS